MAPPVVSLKGSSEIPRVVCMIIIGLWWRNLLRSYPLRGGWTNPSEKYARQNGFIFPNYRWLFFFRSVPDTAGYLKKISASQNGKMATHLPQGFLGWKFPTNGLSWPPPIVERFQGIQVIPENQPVTKVCWMFHRMSCRWLWRTNHPPQDSI